MYLIGFISRVNRKVIGIKFEHIPRYLSHLPFLSITIKYSFRKPHRQFGTWETPHRNIITALNFSIVTGLLLENLHYSIVVQRKLLNLYFMRYYFLLMKNRYFFFQFFSCWQGQLVSKYLHNEKKCGIKICLKLCESMTIFYLF